ncbi:hypothetical protein Q8F55_002105 [Vanrija albida]|uniref:Glucose receptor Git3 N-terminal domain-containing protein n=1 Tax=Vanrija albida TaxID=181172 RepID=A0ABR3Q930_9TREE
MPPVRLPASTLTEATALACSPLLALLAAPHLLGAGVPPARRLAPPALSLALVVALRAAPAALGVVSRARGPAAPLCTADAALTSLLTAAALAHLPAIAFTTHARLETPSRRPRPLTPAFYAALLAACYAFAGAHAVGGAVGAGPAQWGYYCADGAWWWRYARLSLVFPPALALLIALCSATTLYSVHGHPNPRIAPTWRHWASAAYLAACAAAAIAYLSAEVVFWRADWWPRVLEAAIGPAAVLPFTLNTHVWRAYGAWLRLRRAPRPQRLSFEVNAVFVAGPKRASVVLDVDVEALPSPLGPDPFAPPAPREFVGILGAEVECLPPIAEDERGSKISVMSVPESPALATTHPLSPLSGRFYGSPRRSATSAQSLPFVYALSEELEADELRRFPMDFPVSTYSDFSLRPPSARSVGSVYSDEVDLDSGDSNHSRLRLNSKSASRHAPQSSDSLSVLELEGTVLVVSNPVDRRPSMEVARIVNLSRQ